MRNIVGMPVFIQQIYVHNHGILFLAKIAIVVTLAAKRLMFSSWALLALAFELFVNAEWLGSRRDIFALLMAIIVVTDVMIRRIKPANAATGASILLAIFLVAGLLRGGGHALSDGMSLWREVFASTSEFTASFATTLDVEILARRGAAGPLRQAVLSDFLSIIPQQFLSFTKMAPSSWYMQNLYPEAFDAGTGFAFGVAAESATGYGVWEAAARGIFVAGLFSLLNRMVYSKNVNIWKFIIWAFFAVTAYNIFRVGTLYHLPLVVFQCVPFIAVGVFGGRVIGQLSGVTRMNRDPGGDRRIRRLPRISNNRRRPL